MSRRRLLVFGPSHLHKVSFGVLLDQLYRTGLLQRYFEVHQYVGGTDRPVAEVDGIRFHPVTNAVPDELDPVSAVLEDIRPDLVLLVGEIGHYRSTVYALRQWQGAVIGWFPVNFERAVNPYGWSVVLGRCDRVVTQSKFGQQQLLRDQSGGVGLIGLGVNSQVFHRVDAAARQALRTELGWATDGLVFLFVGRNNTRKGAHFAVEAFRLYTADHQAAASRSFLYMHTEVDRGLLELVHAAGLTDRVWFTSDYHPIDHPLPETELAKLYQASDVFLLPSQSEGFGMPLLEAQAAGLPIIATDNSAIPEVVGAAGLLINAPVRTAAYDCDCIAWARPPDVAHAAQLMHRLAGDPSLRSRLSRQGQRQAAARPWHRVAEELLAELRGALPSSNPRTRQLHKAHTETGASAPTRTAVSGSEPVPRMYLRGDIDAVYLWVDHSDPAFRTALERYAPGVHRGATASRLFRDHGELRYSLRSLIQNAPWIRRVHLVTNGQVPRWLDQTSQRLALVRHDEIFPEADHLPTFNSNAIEMNLHRIPGLAEHFLAFNDDMFLGRPVAVEDFISPSGGQALRFSDRSLPTDPTHPHPLYAAAARTQLLLDHLYGPRLHRPWPGHTPRLYSKQTIQQLQSLLPGHFHATGGHRFRHSDDLPLWILYPFHLLEAPAQQGRHHRITYQGNSPDYSCLSLGKHLSRAPAALDALRPRFLCIQDDLNDTTDNNHPANSVLHQALARIFPTPSCFEGAALSTV